jgi:hypothetical protein
MPFGKYGLPIVISLLLPLLARIYMIFELNPSLPLCRLITNEWMFEKLICVGTLVIVFH